jgi:DNA-binding beta-propeller fold protein YncE
MSYTEYLRRKEAAAPKVIDTTVRLDASSYTERVKFAASRMVNEANLKVSDEIQLFTTSTVSGTIMEDQDSRSIVARFYNPRSITTDGYRLFVADTDNNRIRNIVISTGQVFTVAGSGTAGYLDGTGTGAQFSGPHGIVIDPAGLNLYVCDNHRIRKIVISTGDVSTLAGSTSGFNDGTGASAQFNGPTGITIDTAGLNLYVGDSGNHKIRKVVISTGQVTTFAGSTQGFNDAIGTSAQFNSLSGLTVDRSGLNIYVADSSNNKIRKVVISTGQVTTIAGSLQGYQDGIQTNSRFDFPCDVTIDRSGSILYVVDSSNNKIRKILLSTLEVTTFAGSTAGYLDGIGRAAQFNGVRGIIADTRTDTLYVADTVNDIIRKILIPTAQVTTFTGTGSEGFTDDTNPGPLPRFGCFDVAIDSTNTNLYISDFNSHKIKKVVIATGSVITLAGSTQGFADGLITNAQFNNPQGIVIDSTNTNLYVTDYLNHRIRKIVIATGDVTTLAGSTQGFNDAIGASAQFNFPYSLVIDRSGLNLYVVDNSNYRIRKVVISTGQVTTIVGSTQGTLDGIGTSALLSNPRDIAIDATGLNLYFTDANRIRRIIVATNEVTTLAGTTQGVGGFQDGIGAFAQFYTPNGLVVDPTGSNLYIVDNTNGKIRKLSLATNLVTTIAGTVNGFVAGLAENGFVDGVGTIAQFYNPRGIVMDSTGLNMYVADSSKLRKMFLETLYSAIIPVNKTKTGGRIADASTYTQYVGGQAVGKEVQAGMPPPRVLLNSNSVGSLSGCRTVPEPVPYNPAVAGVYSANMVRRDASQFTRDETACRQLTGEPHNANELGPSLFVDNTIVGIKNYNLPQNNAKTYIASKCTQCGNNGAEIAKTCSFCIGANHLHSADKPTNVRWGPRPRKSAQPIIVNQSPSDFHKVGAAMRKIPYVEKHHANPQLGHIIYPKTPYRIPRGTAAQLKINDPMHYPGTM